MTADKNNRNFYMPITLKTDYLPLNTTEFIFALVNSNKTNVYMNTTTSISNLQTFAIYGRNFAQDNLLSTKDII